MNYRIGGNIWGLHRVVSPTGSLPQASLCLDNGLPLYETEILIKVKALQIDSASFRQLIQNGNIESQILEIVSSRGKMHNPVTNSGGMLFGTIEDIGPKYEKKNQFKIGDSILTLVSLTLTPLKIEKIIGIDPKKERVMIEGHAILFSSGILSKMPTDLPEGVVLASLDVCGAPAQVRRLVKKDETVFVLGLGKAGRAVAFEANDLGAHVMGADANPDAVRWCQKNIKGTFECLDAQNASNVTQWMAEQTKNKMADVVISTTNAPDTEMTAMLAAKEGGCVLFFGMNTSFQKSVLGVEGIGKDLTLLMGSGYVPGHAELMLDLVRKHKALREWLEKDYA